MAVTLVDKIRKRRLTWFGHVTRMEGKKLPYTDKGREQGRSPGAEFGGHTNFSRTKISELGFSGKKFPFWGDRPPVPPRSPPLGGNKNQRKTTKEVDR